MVKVRPTEAEFAELKRKNVEKTREAVKRICEEQGWDPAQTSFHASNMDGCYCACPEGPCQHTWDGPEWISEDRCTASATCSLCGATAFSHDLRCAP